MALLSPPSPPPLLAPVRHRLASHHLLALPETASSLLSLAHYHHSLLLPSATSAWPLRRHRRRGITSVAEGDSVPPISFDAEAGAVAVSAEPEDASPEDLENIAEIKRVLDLLQKNRDMTFGEVKLTIMIEDPRDVERKRLLGIEDPDELTRDDLADALVDTSSRACGGDEPSPCSGGGEGAAPQLVHAKARKRQESAAPGGVQETQQQFADLSFLEEICMFQLHRLSKKQLAGEVLLPVAPRYPAAGRELAATATPNDAADRS